MTKSVSSEHVAQDESGESSEKVASSRSLPTGTRVAAAFWQRTQSPLADITRHITEDHIDKSLDITDAQNERVAVDRRESRTFRFRVIVVAAAFLLVLVAVLVFSDNASLLQDVIEWMAAGGVGWAGGYGWAKRRGS